MASCPACRAMTFANYRCSSCGYEEAPVFELELDALEEAEPLSLDALTPLAPESMLGSDDMEPLSLSTDELEPMQLDNADDGAPIPLMEGFEGTMIEERVRPKKVEVKAKRQSAPFVHRICPQCEAPVAEPNPPFCEACGFKLVAKKKKDEAKSEDFKLCGDCGTKNALDRGNCRNCGSRLKSVD